MHATSHRSDFFVCRCGVNIEEPAVCCTGSLPSAVFRVGLPSFPIPTAMSDSKMLNTSSLEVMITSQNKRVFIHGLSDLTFQNMFDAWWPSTNVDSKRPIAWNDCSHAPSW